MKIAASDFDGTLYTREFGVRERDMEAIRRWRETGNRFGIVTGREQKLLMHHLSAYRMPLDFLICNNGAAIFETDYSCIYCAVIAREIVKQLVLHPCTAASNHQLLSTPDKAYAFAVRSDSWIARENFKIEHVNREQAANLQSVTQITLDFSREEEAGRCAETIQAVFGNAISAQTNSTYVDITAVGVDKSSGIQTLLRLKKWPADAVYAIGDEANDLPMLRAFHGFTVQTAREEIKRAAGAVYESVGAMLEDQL